MPPKVAVIYLSYYTPSSPEEIGRCLASLEHVDYPKECWRIIDVENPSPHGASIPFLTSDWLPKAGKTLPEMELHPNVRDLGYAGANVVGVEHARAWGAEYVYLLNQDTAVDPGFLREAVAYAEMHPQDAVIQSRLMLLQDPEKLNSIGNALQILGYGYALGENLTPEAAAKIKDLPAGRQAPVFYASGAAVLVRMSALEKIGGIFDARYYMYHEDTDLSWRARLAGLGIGYADRSVVSHHYEFNRSMKKFYWMERNRWVCALSNLKAKTLAVLLLPMLAADAVTFLFALRSGWAGKKLRAWAFFWKPSTWAWIAERRALAAQIRTVPDRDLLRLMASTVESAQVSPAWKRALVDPLLAAFKALVLAIVRW